MESPIKELSLEQYQNCLIYFDSLDFWIDKDMSSERGTKEMIDCDKYLESLGLFFDSDDIMKKILRQKWKEEYLKGNI